MQVYILNVAWRTDLPVQQFAFADMDSAIPTAIALIRKTQPNFPFSDEEAADMLKAGDGLSERPQVWIEQVELEGDNPLEAFAIAQALGAVPVDPEVTVEPIYHYVLMRQDVPDYLSGKAQAQSNHAGTKMALDVVLAALDGKPHDAEYLALIREWAAEGGGFGTCIVLGVSAYEMRQAVSLAKLLGLHSGIVHDPSYPLRDGEKIQTIPLDTCAFIFGRKSDCYPVVGKFPLLKDKGEK